MLENLGLVLRLVNLLCLGHARKNEVGCRDATVLEGSGRIHPFEERTHAQDAQMASLTSGSFVVCGESDGSSTIGYEADWCVNHGLQ